MAGHQVVANRFLGTEFFSFVLLGRTRDRRRHDCLCRTPAAVPSDRKPLRGTDSEDENYNPKEDGPGLGRRLEERCVLSFG